MLPGLSIVQLVVSKLIKAKVAYDSDVTHVAEQSHGN